ncbi:MAG TPA: hypothetical protein VIO61_17785 [Anaerolineaceae bacterium]
MTEILDLVETFIQNSIAVMTTNPERKTEWCERIRSFMLADHTGSDYLDINIFEEVLNLLEGKPVEPLEEHPFYWVIARIQEGIRHPERTERQYAAEVLAAVQAFLSAEDWKDSRKILFQEQAWLLTPEALEMLDLYTRQAEKKQEHEEVKLLYLHKRILESSMQIGIVRTFEKLGVS